MKIQRSLPTSAPLRRLPASSPEAPPDLYTPSRTSPILRHAAIGGAAALTATGALVLTGQSLQGALQTVGPLVGLAAMGYLLLRTMEPDVPLQPEVLDSLLTGRFSDNDKQSVQKALNALGPDNVKRLQDGGVKLLVDSDKVPAKAGACYYPGERLACFRRGSVDKHYVIHELGHALDNLAANQPNYRSQHDSRLQQNYQNYMNARSPWSEYARTNQQEYLAEGVTYYLDSDQKKAEFQRKDPLHYDYIEKFLKDPTQEEPPNSRKSGQ